MSSYMAALLETLKDYLPSDVAEYVVTPYLEPYHIKNKDVPNHPEYKQWLEKNGKVTSSDKSYLFGKLSDEYFHEKRMWKTYQ